MDEKLAPLASEMYTDLKETNGFLRKLLVWVISGATVIIVALVAALVATNIYHIHKWSEFETVYVDSGEGGNANYVQGDNTGGIYNGESSSTPQEEGQIQGN